MSISLCRRISMALVVCICASFCLLPFRSEALFTEIYQFAQGVQANPITLYIGIADLVLKMSNEMLSGSNQGEPLPSTVAEIAAYWEPYVTTDAVLLTQDQMDQVIQGMKKSGITVQRYHRGDWPDGIEAIRIYSTNIAGYDFAGEIDFGSFYTLNGRTVISKAEKGTTAPTTVTNNYIKEGDTTNITQETIFNTVTNTWETINNTTINNSSTTNNNTYLNEENNTWYDIENNEYKTFNDYSYNPTTNTYTVNFTDGRTYNYQFHYDYTYITYIGSSAEYREAYKVYYELPDGRSSGDLTVDDLKGISLQFDMVNYDKAASDTLTRALYDFDGDLQNSSAFSSSAQWLSGASTSYLESPDGFGGALFNNNPFDLRFSLNGVNYDAYTIQFRLYFENLPTSDFYVYAYGNPWFIVGERDSGTNNLGIFSFTLPLGNQFLPFIRINQNNVYFGYGSSPVASIQAGQWYDFTLCFDWSYRRTASSARPANFNALYLYINGLLVSNGSVRHLKYIFDGTPTIGLRQYTNNFTYFSFATDTLGLKQSFNPNSSSSWKSAGFSNFWFYGSSVTQMYSWVPSGSSSTYPMVTGDYLPPYDFSSLGFKCDGSYTMMLDNLRVVSHALYPGVQSFTPTPVPFDTNLVYVLPSVADLNDNTVAIMSQLPVTGYRVGGIRPTDPTLAAGYVWMHIDGDFVDSVQQWNGAYWEEVTARLYTGVRWIPVTAFNVFTLEDMFDIVDPDGDGGGGGESVSTIYQYYLWWSGEWGTFQQWLQGTMETLIEAIQNSGSGGSGGPVTIVPGYNDQTTTNEITTENLDGSTTVTTIVSNAAGLVYSRSVTTWPPDAEGNVTTREVYTDSSGVMYQTTIITDRDGNVTITEPSEATGTLASILKTITQGVMRIATTVIEAFVNLLVDLVGFVLDSVGRIFTGITNILATLLSAITSFVAELGTAAQFLPAFFSILPAPIQSGFTLIFVGCVAIGLFRLIHF